MNRETAHKVRDKETAMIRYTSNRVYKERIETGEKKVFFGWIHCEPQRKKQTSATTEATAAAAAARVATVKSQCMALNVPFVTSMRCSARTRCEGETERERGGKTETQRV